MLDEFKKFLLRGNVVDLSTGVIIGAAFGAIVSAFTKGVVEPLLALAGSGASPKLAIPLMNKMVEQTTKGPDGKDVITQVQKLIELDLGGILGAFIQFMITAAVIFFVIVKPANYLMAKMKKEEAAAPPPGPTPTEALLAEIRDLLLKNSRSRKSSFKSTLPHFRVSAFFILTKKEIHGRRLNYLTDS
ncbi:MAG: large conductance mechanosensitive channel protein MscL [Akkermansiaceae bacterium]|nr:large conductance mechanosensitive channel protein MscL [Akkermansiaceae bacterium]